METEHIIPDDHFAHSTGETGCLCMCTSLRVIDDSGTRIIVTHNAMP